MQLDEKYPSVKNWKVYIQKKKTSVKIKQKKTRNSTSYHTLCQIKTERVNVLKYATHKLQKNIIKLQHICYHE